MHHLSKFRHTLSQRLNFIILGFCVRYQFLIQPLDGRQCHPRLVNRANGLFALSPNLPAGKNRSLGAMAGRAAISGIQNDFAVGERKVYDVKTTVGIEPGHFTVPNLTHSVSRLIAS